MKEGEEGRREGEEERESRVDKEKEGRWNKRRM